MRVFSSLIYFICFTFSLHGQGTKFVGFKHAPMGYAPAGFYIHDVVDDRSSKDVVGTMTSGLKVSDIKFQSGAAPAIKDYLAKEVSQNHTKQGVVLHIEKLSIGIKKVGAEWQEEANAVFSFYIAGKNLVEFTARAKRTTEDDPLPFIEEFIRNTLEKNFRQFDTWWAEHKGEITVQESVKVIASIGTSINRPGCIAYSLQRPLQIADFKGRAEGNVEELAATSSGADMRTAAQTENGQLVLNVVITPFFSRPESWFKEEGKSPRVLAHEQAHFDITAINACNLITKIRNTAFTEDNYQQKLQELLTENSENISKEQARYDAETNHGRIMEKQLEWQNRISKQVRCNS